MQTAITGQTQGGYRRRGPAIACPDRVPEKASGMLTIWTVAASLMLIATAGHATNFKPPQGCRLEVTAQNRGCSVAQYFRCDADPQGDQHSAVFTREGLTYQAHIDAETRWLNSRDPQSGIEDQLIEDSADHASFSTLIQSGRDDFDFLTESNTGERLRHVGFDELTGNTMTIDGVELEETRFDLRTYDENGQELIHRTGQQYISRSMGRFYGGIEAQTDWTGADITTNDTPVLFSFPGEDGFGETEPKFDCDELLARIRRLQQDQPA